MPPAGRPNRPEKDEKSFARGVGMCYKKSTRETGFLSLKRHAKRRMKR